MVKVKPNLLNDIKKLGAFDVSACYSCGTCTAICPLSEENHEFPRKLIRYAMVGDEKKILMSTEPWLCYYCGECTRTCPRGADPAGFMMALRRYLTTKYDFTGFSRLFYRSKKVEFFAGSLLFLLTVFIIYLFHGPIILTSVDLVSFAPLHIVELGDIIVIIVLSSILLTNIYRMFRFTVLWQKKGSIPFTTYLKELFKTLALHFFTQKRWLKCEEGLWDWIMHILIVYGYATLFIFGVFLLDLWQTNTLYPIYNPVRLTTYIASAALMIGSSYGIYGRIKKNSTMRQFSHSTDWYFLTLLYLTIITGIGITVFKYMGDPMATYITYTIHLGFVVPLLVLEVPFAKWSHLAYRPFALYFTKLKDALSKIAVKS
ncbi:MAG: 4Fe-4S dicluster domain-containing protein [Thermoplasmata archaeon]|jgi:ferredoxin|uniref:4Fe-4S dicluster domain-containing protein n=1 Tax=Caldisericum sp. TaxID=2499687 RepID=UPI00176802D2|nr:4Fe-4S ferredoxin [Euryarchaeota archaeon]